MCETAVWKLARISKNPCFTGPMVGGCHRIRSGPKFVDKYEYLR